jgi:hypothetical protein
VRHPATEHGEPGVICIPDERHEAMRDLSRAREAARKDHKGKREQVSSFMLRLGRHYPGKTTWGPAHMNWLMLQKLEHREQRIALEELVGAVSSKMISIIDRRPRAPVLRSIAFLEIAPSASSAKVRSTISISRWYCLTSAFFGAPARRDLQG